MVSDSETIDSGRRPLCGIRPTETHWVRTTIGARQSTSKYVYHNNRLRILDEFTGWTAVTQSPQPQYVGQQIQLEDIRYHSPANTLHYSTHAPPNVYNQPIYQTVSPAQTPATGFIQVSNGFPQPQVTTSSLINGVPNVAPTLNGNVEYLESSGRTDFVNGTPNYNHISQTVRIHFFLSHDFATVFGPSSTLKCIRFVFQVQAHSPSSQTMDPSNDTSVKVVNGSFSQPGAGNAIPGYPPQQPPQSQQSLHNSNG